jgi:hypothetical protein
MPGYTDRHGIDNRANSVLGRAELIVNARHVPPAVRLVQLAELMADEPILTDESSAAYGVREEGRVRAAIASRES